MSAGASPPNAAATTEADSEELVPCTLWEYCAYFLRLGTLGFGAALISRCAGARRRRPTSGAQRLCRARSCRDAFVCSRHTSSAHRGRHYCGVSAWSASPTRTAARAKAATSLFTANETFTVPSVDSAFPPVTDATRFASMARLTSAVASGAGDPNVDSRTCGDGEPFGSCGAADAVVTTAAVFDAVDAGACAGCLLHAKGRSVSTQ